MVSTGLSLKAANLPSQELSFTNKIYASPSDVAQLVGKNSGFVDVKGCIFTIEGHQALQNGSIALNKVQREHAKIGLNMEVFVKGFQPKAGSDLGSVNIEVDLFIKPQANAAAKEVKADDLEPVFRQRFANQVLSQGQPLVLDFNSEIIKFNVLSCQGLDLGDGKAPAATLQGILLSQTEIDFRQGSSGKLHVLSNKMQSRSIFTPNFNFEDLGIGGLSKEFGDIFRRAFAARVFPAHVVKDLGIQHIKGMLLYGPPGCGKTLIARKLAKFLNSVEPKIVNGPEILNKYVGASEENIRNLFADAEKEFKEQGANSQLHIIIFDEIDAICKARGSKGSDSTGVGDTVVNQLLTKIDGVDALDNILLIGMTNRMDLIDPAIIRPGRLELHVEINLPDENGRVDILNIHTKGMKEKGYLAPDVVVPDIAKNTKNYSGAELSGVVRAAASYALNRKVDFKDLSKTSSQDMSEILVTGTDFEMALTDIKPAFGKKDDDFEGCIRHGILSYSAEFDSIVATCRGLMDQVRTSESTPLLSILLEGRPGTGKTALAAHLAAESGFPYVRRIGPEQFVGWGEHARTEEIAKVFADAYKTPLSVVVLDDLERLMDYVPIGPRFSNIILQALSSLLKKAPPKAKSGTRDQGRILIIGTTSNKAFLEDSELFHAFNVALSIPNLCAPEHFKTVLKVQPGFTPAVVEEVANEMLGRGLGISKLLLVADMAAQRANPVTKEIFLECLSHVSS